ncbi:MAG: arginyltransferase [Fuerstiella sp.]|nr:arginyltransferase [Fuerstiella sp.]MCP4856341.1 arginyltransferase [Fuerstiella sp.]
MTRENRSNRTADEIELLGSESACSYLPNRNSRMIYRIALSLTSARYDHLLSRGWRRFGRTLFRPQCDRCVECQSLRIDIAAFKPTKSQRQARNRNAAIDLTVGPVTVTEEHVALYNAYHRDMHERRQWPIREITEEDYHESFVDGNFPFAREFQYRLHGELLAVGIVDMTGTAMSSIYFIHDPAIRHKAPGTMSVLREVEEGRRTGHSLLYMGYYIRDCGSMSYKNRYAPHQLLAEYVQDDVEPDWGMPDPTAEDQRLTSG